MRNEIAFGDSAAVGLYAGAIRNGSTEAAADRQVKMYNLLHADELRAQYEAVQARRLAVAPLAGEAGVLGAE